jgi:hypothetical protein
MHHEPVTANPLLTAGVTRPAVDTGLCAAWVTVVHQVARETGARALGTPERPGPGRNHYRIRVDHADGSRTRLLLNAAAALVAATDAADPDSLVAPFREVPRGDLFGLAGLRVATPAELERPLTHDQAAALAEAELRDIAYHGPLRVGDAIFNWFD